jgi:2-phospho-L-lactate/phosphoenolpyruvate guanylyltransferase
VRAVLVPVKSFRHAKARLASVLGEVERRSLARELAARVLRSAWPLPTAVVCDDPDVASFAELEGAHVIWTPGLGLSGAVEAGVEHLRGRGFTLVTVAHGDLPRAQGLADIGEPGAITLVPDLRMNGTNVASVPAAAGFRFSYGEGSFERHKVEAARVGLPCRVVYDARFAIDIDVPADLLLAGLATRPS